MQAALQAAHGKSSAMFQQLQQSRKMLDAVRSKLDSLTSKGDVVTPEDVIKAAGDLTAHGLDPKALAQLLSTMPEGGGMGLAAWVQQQDEMAKQREMAVDQQLGGAAHQQGVDAMHLLMHQHMTSPKASSPQPSGQPSAGTPSPQQPNPLM